LRTEHDEQLGQLLEEHEQATAKVKDEAKTRETALKGELDQAKGTVTARDERIALLEGQVAETTKAVKKAGEVLNALNEAERELGAARATALESLKVVLELAPPPTANGAASEATGS
jgi:hypothetical protein